MRVVSPALLILLLWMPVARAGDATIPITPALRQIPGAEQTIAIRYDSESLTTTIELGIGRGRLSFGIANAFELPEYEPAAGTFIDQETLLTDELSGFEVDTSGERMFSLTFSVHW